MNKIEKEKKSETYFLDNCCLIVRQYCVVNENKHAITYYGICQVLYNLWIYLKEIWKNSFIYKIKRFKKNYKE